MAVLVKLSTVLRQCIPDYDPIRGLSLEDAAGITVRQALTRAGIPVDKIKIVLVNGLAASLEDVLKDGDRLGLFPPVGGG